MQPPTEPTPALVVISGSHVGAMFRLDRSTMVLGRAEDADVIIEDQGISRRHCQLVIEGDEVHLEDLGSTNGTWINYDRIDRVKLRSGDRIRIGQRTVLKFSYQDHDEETYQRTLYEAGVRDSLTGAFNQRFFHERLGSEQAFSLRHGAPLSLLRLAVDGFKAIGTEQGAPTGDAVLSQLARTIRAAIRSEDVFARLDEEEFAVIARGLTCGQAFDFADRLRLLIESQPFEDKGDPLQITISVGTATSEPPLPVVGDALVRQAETALAKAKQGGPNRVEPPRPEPHQDAVT